MSSKSRLALADRSSGRPDRPRSLAKPSRPPAWSKCPWLSTTPCRPPTSMPRRWAFTASASGEAPVSNSTVLLVFPLRTVTRAEKPCSARRPATVSPSANCGAATRPAPIGTRVTLPPEASRASKVLSTIVVTVTSSTSGSVTGSTADPSAARGADHAASAAACP
ncbi:MAG TPA: hypothetical protein VGG54_14065 [Trebonia sp.]